MHNDLASVDSQAHNWKTRLHAAPVLFLRQGSTEAWRAVWLSSKHLDVVSTRDTALYTADRYQPSRARCYCGCDGIGGWLANGDSFNAALTARYSPAIAAAAPPASPSSQPRATPVSGDPQRDFYAVGGGGCGVSRSTTASSNDVVRPTPFN